MASWVIEYVHLYKVPTYLELHTSHSHQKSVSGSYSQGVKSGDPRELTKLSKKESFKLLVPQL